jgi:hypothetical protein
MSKSKQPVGYSNEEILEYIEDLKRHGYGELTLKVDHGQVIDVAVKERPKPDAER